MPRPHEADYYRQQAQAEGYVSRAVYKLQALDRKYHLFRPGQRVLDLGCSPGSWLQYLARRVGPQGLVLGVDVVPLRIPLAPPLDFLLGDIQSIDFGILRAKSLYFDVVVSDLAPKTSGMKAVDQERSWLLALRAWEIAQELLATGGHFLVKIFEGPDTNRLVAWLKEAFASCHRVKPAGSRPASKELYLLGRGRRPGSRGADRSA
jgi:23S rRNA (uridine2552-2'-O)-methyltransferase